MYISDEAVLQMERQRAALNTILIEKGITTKTGLPLNDMINICDNLENGKDTADLIANQIADDYRNDAIKIIDDYGFYKKNIPHLLLKGLKQVNYCGMYKVTTNNLILGNLESVVGTSYMFGECVGNNFVAPKLTKPNTSYGFFGPTSFPNIIVPNYSRNLDIFGNSSHRTLKLLDVTQTGFAGLNNSQIETMIIRNSNVTSLANVAHLTNTLNCTIYVPSDLIESYKIATNWSTVYAQGKVNFVALEGSKYESKKWFMNEQWYKDEEAYWQNKYQNPDFHIIDDESWAD